MKTDATTEHPFSFGSASEPMWGMLYLPAGAPSGAWVLCPPLGDERGYSQRIFVEWARLLCRNGYAALRFDYRGAGNSGASDGRHGLEHYVADVQSAVQELKQRAGTISAGLCGMRLGATLAVMAAAKNNGTKLLLWEPIEDGLVYANNLLRMAMATQMSHGTANRYNREQLREMLAQGGTVVARGQVLCGPLLQSLEQIDLSAESRSGSSRTLVVGISSNPQRQQDLQQTFRDFSNVQVCQLEIPPPWTETKEYDVKPSALFELSLDWIRREGESCAPDKAQPCAAATPAPVADSELEQVVSFEAQGSQLWGIVHKPVRPEPDRPVVLIPWMATELYVRLARYLARSGWTVLRFDPRGKGDSEGHLNYSTLIQLWNATERGLLVTDTEAAMDFAARELGARRMVLAGVCGDAITSTIIGARDSRVAGIILLELPMLYTPSAGATQTLMAMRRALSYQQGRLFRAMIAAIDLAWKCSLHLQKFYAWVKAGVTKRLSPFRKKISWSTTVLGAQANEIMLDALAGCLTGTTPALCIFAPKRNWMLFQTLLPELKKLCRDNMALEYRVVNGADHVFSMPQHMDEVGQICVRWLGKR